jgi:hypothetical protein
VEVIRSSVLFILSVLEVLRVSELFSFCMLCKLDPLPRETAAGAALPAANVTSLLLQVMSPSPCWWCFELQLEGTEAPSSAAGAVVAFGASNKLLP